MAIQEVVKHPVDVNKLYLSPHSCIRTVGERLTYFRKCAGLDLEDLARITAISKSELSRLENNGRALTSAHRAVLSKAYGMQRLQFDTILAFDPLTQAMPVKPDEAEDTLFRPRREMPCYSSETFPDLPETPRRIGLAMDMPLSPAGYAICLEDAWDFLSAGTLIVADPAARTVLGDLVVNVLDHRALLLTLYRDDNGTLSGKTGMAAISFPGRVSVTSFHKVIAMFPAPHLVIL